MRSEGGLPFDPYLPASGTGLSGKRKFWLELPAKGLAKPVVVWYSIL
jgi:hypothetical protein